VEGTRFSDFRGALGRRRQVGSEVRAPSVFGETMSKTIFQCVVTLFGAGAAFGTNIVLNPGFETGNFTSWTADSGPHWLVESSDGAILGPHSGNFYANNACSGASCITTPNSFLFQNLTTVVNQAYTLTFWYDRGAMFTGPAGPEELLVLWNGTHAIDLAQATSGFSDPGWTQFTVTGLTASSTSTHLEFRGRQDSAQLGVDDIDVEASSAVPEPASLTFVASALLGFGLFAKYRKRNLYGIGHDAATRLPAIQMKSRYKLQGEDEMRFRFAPLMALLATTALVHAANVINATGPSPFFFGGQAVFVAAWSQGAAYTNVTITMPLEDRSNGGPIGGVEGTVYLMNQIGPGTTTTNQVAPPIAISGLTNAFTSRALFTGLTLPAGSYYVVLVPTNTDPSSMSPGASNSAVVTTGTSVTFLGAGNTSSAAVYPPATSVPLGTAEGSLLFTVTGDPAGSIPTTPVPPSLILTLTAMGGVGIYRGRKFLRRRTVQS
jgi:hypothetical protein